MYMYMYMYMYDVYKQMVMDKVIEGGVYVCVCVCVCATGTVIASFCTLTFPMLYMYLGEG